MRFISCLIFSLLFASAGQAQQNHFVYIQTENKQPFSVRLNEKIYNAAASGFVILSKLNSGTYKLVIGFPGNEWPSQSIDINVNDRDQGFVLKNFGEKGWGLFNTQTMDIAMASGGVKMSVPTNQDGSGGFSNVLAAVTNTAVSQQLLPPSANATVSPVGSASTPPPALPASNTTEVASVVAQGPASKQDNYPADSLKSTPKETVNMAVAVPVTVNVVQRIFSFIDSTGRSAIYTTENDGRKDTIRIFIPYAKALEPAVIRDVIITDKDVKSDGSKEDKKMVLPMNDLPDSAIKKEAQPVQAAISNAISAKQPVTDLNVAAVNKEQGATVKANPANSSCSLNASDRDFLKLRLKMATASREDEMVAIAKKGFKAKCFTTDQVKNLGLLFLKDEGKYNFYDAAYGHVSDQENFRSLETQLTEEYYRARFRAMLR